MVPFRRVREKVSALSRPCPPAALRRRVSGALALAPFIRLAAERSAKSIELSCAYRGRAALGNRGGFDAPAAGAASTRRDLRTSSRGHFTATAYRPRRSPDPVRTRRENRMHGKEV